MQDEDLSKILVASAHLGAQNLNYQMEQYVYKRKNDGVCLFNIKKMWEKLVLAARVIAAVENPADVCIISARQISQRAVLKYARYTGATPIAGRFTPGSFTNQIQSAFKEPRLIIVTDPIADHQPITEASYCNIPIIAFTNSDNLLRHIDVAIPCNNRGPVSVGLMIWFLAREVLRIRGQLPRSEPWDVMPDLFFYRDQEEMAKEEQQATTEAQDQLEQNLNPVADQEWEQAGVQGGQNDALASGFVPSDDWGAVDDNWNKPVAENWTAAPTSTNWSATN